MDTSDYLKWERASLLHEALAAFRRGEYWHAGAVGSMCYDRAAFCDTPDVYLRSPERTAIACLTRIAACQRVGRDAPAGVYARLMQACDTLERRYPVDIAPCDDADARAADADAAYHKQYNFR